MWHWELDAAGQELLGVGPLGGDRDLVAVDFRVVPLEGTHARRYKPGVNDLDAAEASAVTTSQLRIHLLNSAAKRNIAVLLVHIVGTTARVVLDGDAVDLHDVGVLFPDLVASQDLTGGLLQLVQLVQEVPAE